MALKTNHPPTLMLPSPTTCLPSSPAVFLKSSLLTSGRITISVVTQLIREQCTEMNVVFEGKGMTFFGYIYSTEVVSAILLVTVIHKLIFTPLGAMNSLMIGAQPVLVCVFVWVWVCVCVRQQVCNRTQVHPGP